MKLSLILLVLFVVSFTSAQNLVPNPSFEDTIACPNFLGQTNLATGWNININTADYLNSCANSASCVSVPLNCLGFQYPSSFSCNAYCGLITYVQVNPGSGEFLGRQLSSPLIPSQKYYVSLKVNLSNAPAVNCGMDKLGVKFTNVDYGDTTIFFPDFVNNSAHIYSTTIITDTLNWTVISGSFIADSSYQYILIGHFFDNNHTNYTCFNSNSKFSYYFIDDICVSSDSLDCYLYTSNCNPEGFEDILQISEIDIYPNPAKNEIKINLPYKDENSVLRIYNLFGAVERQYKLKSLQNILSLGSMNPGVYITEIYFANQLNKKKIIILN